MFEWHNRRIYRDFMLMRIKKILARLLISASFLLLAAMVSMAQVPLHGELAGSEAQINAPPPEARSEAADKQPPIAARTSPVPAVLLA